MIALPLFSGLRLLTLDRAIVASVWLMSLPRTLTLSDLAVGPSLIPPEQSEGRIISKLAVLAALRHSRSMTDLCGFADVPSVDSGGSAPLGRRLDWPEVLGAQVFTGAALVLCLLISGGEFGVA